MEIVYYPDPVLRRKAEPVAWDALVVITHKDNPVNDISLENLRAVYRGQITNWKELGGPDRSTTALAPTFTLSPMVIPPNPFAPAPTTT